MMKKNADVIEEYKSNIIKRLEHEKVNMGGYYEWWKSLEGFRNSISRYASHVINGGYRVHPIVLEDGNLVDHHIISYFAPLEFKARGWGGKMLTPAQHIREFADFFIKRGKRFIYVPLPNKGVIYPSIISNATSGLQMNSPQWRMYLNSIVTQSNGIEVVDAFDILMKNKDECAVFSKGHHISSLGADIIAKELGQYLINSIPDIHPQIKLKSRQSRWKYYDWDYITRDHTYYEDLIIHYAEYDDNPFYPTDSTNSNIGVIGDCNLQHYQMHSAGFVSSLTYYTQCLFDEVGRFLPFDYVCPVTRDILKRLLNKEIIIYVAFASASFVRSRLFSRRRLGFPNTWSTLKLE